MRRLAWIRFALVGLAIAAPTTVQAQLFSRARENPDMTAQAPAAHKHRKSLFGREHLCVACQRAKVKAQDGVDIPPPPSLAAGSMSDAGSCTTCGNHTVVASGRPGQGMMVHQGQTNIPMPSTPMTPGVGYAAVGGDAQTYYASMDSEPAAIGTVSPRLAAASPPPAASSRTRDASVGMSAFTPSPVKPPGANRPHVLSHLLGVADIGRDSRTARARRKEENHAAISYGPDNKTVTDVPASIVYGRGR